MADWEQQNRDAAHRHAAHALDDFLALRRTFGRHSIEAESLLHSISHHLRHAVFRTGEDVDRSKRRYPERDR